MYFRPIFKRGPPWSPIWPKVEVQWFGYLRSKSCKDSWKLFDRYHIPCHIPSMGEKCISDRNLLAIFWETLHNHKTCSQKNSQEYLESVSVSFIFPGPSVMRQFRTCEPRSNFKNHLRAEARRGGKNTIQHGFFICHIDAGVGTSSSAASGKILLPTHGTLLDPGLYPRVYFSSRIFDTSRVESSNGQTIRQSSARIKR